MRWVKLLILPELSLSWFLYRLPFYVNMIANGYFYYWSVRADFTRWQVVDNRGFLEGSYAVATVSWFVAMSLWWRNSRKGKRDCRGICYLILAAGGNLIYWHLAEFHLLRFPSL